MPWVLNASGASDNETDEAETIAAVHDALMTDVAGCREAKLSTEYHGLIDLLGETPDDDGE